MTKEARIDNTAIFKKDINSKQNINMVHQIFSDKFYKWWAVLAFLTVIILYFFGLPRMNGYEDYGYIFWTIGMLFCGLIFGSIIYLLYRLISGKWNNKVLMICISIMWFIVLVLIRR